MAMVMTDKAHYEGIASALRSLHDGEETYTPAEMAEYLATQGRELKPENIAEGVTVFGITGTMKYNLKDEWPPDIPPIPEFDEVVGGLDPDAPTMDKMLLMDDKGNVTVGYMYNKAVTGRYNYGGAALPRIPTENESSYPYACIVATYTKDGAISSAKLYRSTGVIGFAWRDSSTYTGPGKLWTNGKSWCIYSYSSSTGLWGTPTYDSGTNVFGGPYCMAVLGESEEVIWCNENMREYVPVLNGNEDYISSTVWMYGSPTEPAKFTVTAYNYRTTDFRAIGWIRVAYHTTGEHAGQYTIDDFRTTESGGWNYIKNVRWCSRAKLEYLGTDIWPKGPQMYKYGEYLIPFSPEEFMRPGTSLENYPYAFVGYSSGKAWFFASSVPMINSGVNRLLFTTSGGNYPFLKHMLCFQSGKPTPIISDTDINTYILTTVIWTNHTIKKTTGEVYCEIGPDPVPVRIPDFDFEGE